MRHLLLPFQNSGIRTHITNFKLKLPCILFSLNMSSFSNKEIPSRFLTICFFLKLLYILMMQNFKKTSLLPSRKYIIIILFDHFPCLKKMNCSSSSLEGLKQLRCGNSEQIKLTEKYTMSCSEFHICDIERSTREFYIVKLWMYDLFFTSYFHWFPLFLQSVSGKCHVFLWWIYGDPTFNTNVYDKGKYNFGNIQHLN